MPKTAPTPLTLDMSALHENGQEVEIEIGHPREELCVCRRCPRHRAAGLQLMILRAP
ncbi:MAG: hypothetical protein R3C97_14605 [Geminicoccaceae bacterium]